MKVIILAAGRGRRLAPITDNHPKALTPLKNGKTILDFQVENLTEFFHTKDILVVVGYKKEMIMKAHPELNYIYNDEYMRNNTGKSLLKGISAIALDDVLWINGDVFFDKGVIPLILQSDTSCVLVDKKKCGEEEIKYTLDSKGYIKQLSKKVSLDEAKGEALGINMVKKKDFLIFKKHLELIGENDYFEKAIENMITKDNVKVLPIDKGNLFCEEIDFPEDLRRVREYLRARAI